MMANAIEYLNILDVHRSATMVFSPDTGAKIIYKGVKYTSEEFNAAFPIPTKVENFSDVYKGENSDTSKAWMND